MCPSGPVLYVIYEPSGIRIGKLFLLVSYNSLRRQGLFFPVFNDPPEYKLPPPSVAWA